MLFSKDPMHIALWYTAINIAAMVLLYVLASERMGRMTGLLTIFLFSISTTMVVHGKSIWEPHPVVFFVSASLLLLHRAWAVKRIRLLLLALIFYGLAMATYLSAYILFPFYVIHVFRWLRYAQHRSVLYAIIVTGLLICLMCLAVFGSQIVLEIQTGLPSLGSLQSPYFALPTPAIGFKRLASTIHLLFADFFRFDVMQFPFSRDMAVSMVLGWTLVVGGFAVFEKNKLGESFRKLVQFMSLPTLVLGACAFIFYTHDAYSWRLNAYYPFVLVLFAGLLQVLFVSRYSILRASAFGLLCLYVMGNMFLWVYITVLKPTTDMPTAQAITSYVRSNAHAAQLRSGQLVVHMYTPGDKWDYEVTPIWYLLSQTDQYTYHIQARGNDIVRPVTDVSASRSYLVCRGFDSFVVVLSECVGTYTQRNPTFQLVARKILINNTYIFVFDRQISSNPL